MQHEGNADCDSDVMVRMGVVMCKMRRRRMRRRRRMGRMRRGRTRSTREEEFSIIMPMLLMVMLSGNQYALTLPVPSRHNVGALIVRIGFGGILYYNKYNEEPPKPYSKYLGPYIML